VKSSVRLWETGRQQGNPCERSIQCHGPTHSRPVALVGDQPPEGGPGLTISPAVPNVMSRHAIAKTKLSSMHVGLVSSFNKSPYAHVPYRERSRIREGGTIVLLFFVIPTVIGSVPGENPS
jgi:hypothetical protein